MPSMCARWEQRRGCLLRLLQVKTAARHECTTSRPAAAAAAATAAGAQGGAACPRCERLPTAGSSVATAGPPATTDAAAAGAPGAVDSTGREWLRGADAQAARAHKGLNDLHALLRAWPLLRVARAARHQIRYLLRRLFWHPADQPRTRSADSTEARARLGAPLVRQSSWEHQSESTMWGRRSHTWNSCPEGSPTGCNMLEGEGTWAQGQIPAPRHSGLTWSCAFSERTQLHTRAVHKEYFMVLIRIKERLHTSRWDAWGQARTGCHASCRARRGVQA